MSNEVPWFERKLTFGYPAEMLPYYLERLQGTIVRMQEKVKNVPDSILSERYNGKWSIKQNIGHLAEVDEVANKRLDEMVKGVEVMSPAVFEPKDYNPIPIQEVLTYFKTTRLANLAKYQSLSSGDLLKSSVHPRLKVKMTPVDLAWFDAEHDDHHLVKISQILENYAKA
ncbi:MAG: DinB family protein [Flammeovirgaceae bacterium]|nr:DinB family protein [Flammeovirgaceae bacterium]